VKVLLKLANGHTFRTQSCSSKSKNLMLLLGTYPSIVDPSIHPSIELSTDNQICHSEPQSFFHGDSATRPIFLKPPKKDGERERTAKAGQWPTESHIS